MNDRIIKALAYNGKVNVTCIDSTQIVEFITIEALYFYISLIRKIIKN